MGCETELLEWIRLYNAKRFFDAAEGRQYTIEKKKREENETNLKEHEEYMLTKGFKFEQHGVVLPNGEKYEFND